MNMTKGFRDAVLKVTLHQDIFFTDLLYNLKVQAKTPLTVRGQRTIACTDGVRLLYDAEMWEDLPIATRVFVLLHELMHVALGHTFRRGSRRHDVWNIACDYVINDMLVIAGNTLPDEGGLHDIRFRNMSAEQVYDILIEEIPPGGHGEGDEKPVGGSGDPGGQCEEKETPPTWQDLIDYDPRENDGVQRDSAEQQSKEIVEKAKAVSKSQRAGKGSPLIDRITELTDVEHIPWHTLLSRHMHCRKAKDADWVKLNYRRMAMFNVVCPRYQSRKLGKIVVGVDCSGSISQTQLSSMSSHLSHIMHDCHPEQIVVIYFDHNVIDVVEYDRHVFDIKLELKGGGGTDFVPVFERLSTAYSDASLMIMMTDMYGPFPEEPTIPTIWVTSTESLEPPFGEVIYADFND